MKKLLVLLLAMFLLTACESEANSPVEDANDITTINTATTHTIESKDAIVDSSTTEVVTPINTATTHTIESNDAIVDSSTTEVVTPSVAGMTVNIPGRLSLDSVSDYEQWLNVNQDSLPKGFITYEMLKKACQIGKFESFMVMGEDQPNAYSYGVYDTTGLWMTIKIKLNYEETHNQISDSLTDEAIILTSDMRTIAITDQVMHVNRNNVKYSYIGGELYKISWVHDGTKVTISTIYHEFYQYPAEGGNPFLTALLNSNTAEAAMNQWKADLKEVLAK